MRILFLCSSLEPGRDGVGDYVRRLAAACLRLGHECAILALNDSFVAEPLHACLKTESGAFKTARIPTTLPWSERTKIAAAFRDRFSPDWISFQLVPYAFNKRGVLLRRIRDFRAITGDCPVHLMPHELWIGAGKPSPLRVRFTGWLQRAGLARLLRAIRPRLITTSNPVYAAMVRKLGVQVLVLPLFGNVPVLISPDPAFMKSSQAQVGITPENRSDSWVALFFGSLHPEWQPEPFMGLLLRTAKRAGKKVCLVLVGRAGAAGEVTWKKMQTDYGAQIAFVELGEQPAHLVSRLMQMADFGIAASPWQLIGKSGTVAAMLDHGLPVIVTRDDFQPAIPAAEPPSTDPLLHLCDEFLEAKLAAGLVKRRPCERTNEIAFQLCTRLESDVPAAS
jgi:glycosyltransferase involved in cell wall biosynthesis